MEKITNINNITNNVYQGNVANSVQSFGKIDKQEDSFEKRNSNNIENNGFLTNLKQKANDFYYIATQKIHSLFKKKNLKPMYNNETIESYQQHALEFQKTPEGIRRKNMTDKEIENEVKNIFNEVMKELEIPRKQQPYLIVTNEKSRLGGEYTKSTNAIIFNSFNYRNGLMDIETTIMHEATHCNEALLRAGIPQYRIDEIVENELISKIKNGDNVTVAVSEIKTIQPPNFPNEMKADFVQFAKENLYNKSLKFNIVLASYESEVNKILEKNPDETEFYNKFGWIDKKFLKLLDKNNKILNIETELKNMINKYPEFQKQYKSEGEAFHHLLQYSLSHNERYQECTDTKAGAGIIFRGVGINVEKLSGDKLKLAEQSLINSIKLLDDTINMNTKGDKKSYIFYRYTPEEVLADTNGYEFFIKKLNQKYEKMKENDTLTKQDETYLTLKIKQSKLEIERLKLGEKIRKMLIELINNPDNNELEKEIESFAPKGLTLKNEIKKIEEELMQMRPE